MSTQQDVYAAGSKNRPSMPNKDNYVPWSSRLLHYAKIKPNGKMLANSILHGPYTDDELIEKEAKQMEDDDQGSDIGEQEKKAKLFNEWELFRSKGESI
ncbi:hypothetical protein Tco_1165328, partial [Tanacetum coccineum]